LFLFVLGICLQGETEDELPESVLAACTVKRIDFNQAIDLED
jgi:hypothetical protein